MDLGAVSLGDSQFDTVNFAPKDRAGQPANPVITAGGFDATLLSVVVAADNKSAVFTALGPLGGPTTITFTGTNADGSVVPDGATVEVTVVAEKPSSLNATLGTPTEKP